MRGSCKPPLLEDPDGMVLTVLCHFFSLIFFLLSFRLRYDSTCGGRLVRPPCLGGSVE